MKKIQFSILLVSFVSCLNADPADPTQVDSDYAVQGEYSGMINAKKVACQVVAMGEGDFMVRQYEGGLPGDGWNLGKNIILRGSLNEKGIADCLNQEKTSRFTIKDGVAKFWMKDEVLGSLQKIDRKSPTLGAKPPKKAIVLFEGASAENFKPGRMTDDHLLMEGAKSIKLFADHRLHIEFRLPYKPKARGQGRGNSGLYLQGRYEVQMLDSFGLEGKNNECGGVYGIASPRENMCFPPLVWQTYDVDFTAARFSKGKKTKNAFMTVRHNGVVIHDKLELPKRTTASPLKEGPEPGFVYLQNHGNPVRYRNIWVLPL